MNMLRGTCLTRHQDLRARLAVVGAQGADGARDELSREAGRVAPVAVPHLAETSRGVKYMKKVGEQKGCKGAERTKTKKAGTRLVHSWQVLVCNKGLALLTVG